MCIQILLLSKFRQQNTNLVRNIADGVIVGGFTPIGELACNREPLLTRCFMGLNQMVFGLDELV